MDNIHCTLYFVSNGHCECAVYIVIGHRSTSPTYMEKAWWSDQCIKTPKNWGGDEQNCWETPKNLGRRRTPQNGPPAATWTFSMYDHQAANTGSHITCWLCSVHCTQWVVKWSTLLKVVVTVKSSVCLQIGLGSWSTIASKKCLFAPKKCLFAPKCAKSFRKLPN